MVPDPRTVPDGQVARVVFGVVVALFSVILLGPTSLEFWTKTAILASLVIACAMRFGLARVLEPFEEEGVWTGIRRLGWRMPAVAAVAAICVGCVPVSSDIATHAPQPAAELSDGSLPRVALVVGSGPDVGSWIITNGAAALPPPGAHQQPVSGSAPVWALPAIPSVSIPSNVNSFDPSITQAVATRMAHDVVLDLVIESDARRAHDLKLAAMGADGDALTEFTDVIKGDGGKIILKTYKFDQVSLNLFLPKFSTQAARLVGVSLVGTATFTTLDSSGHTLSRSTQSYTKSWGLGQPSADGSYSVIANDYTDLTKA
jgi:hypothetical protein